MTTLFAAASAPRKLIGRTDEMERIRRAVYAPGNALCAVTLIGEGGLGKTRMLMEVRAAVLPREQEDAALRPDLVWHDPQQPVLTSEVLDLTPVRLSTTIHFLGALVEALDPHYGFFPAFRQKQLHHRDALVQQSSYERIQEALRDVLDAFERDYRRMAQQQRIVWLLDTGEKFAVPIPREFDRTAQKLLAESAPLQRRDVDVPIYTIDWLSEIFKQQPPWLANTTVVMAGRAQRGWWTVFEGLGGEPAVQTLPLAPLSPAEIPDYFEQLALDLEADQATAAEGALEYATQRLRDLAAADRAWVVWAYTNGQPVRLALLADVVLDARWEPEQLFVSLDEAKRTLGWDGKEFAGPGRQQAIATLEGEFVRLLFDNTDDLRARILGYLARAQHPLDAAVVEYLDSSRPGEHYWLWKANSQNERLKEIRGELAWLKNLAFFKSRGAATGDGGEQQPEIYLQDVIYEIFDRHFAALPDPQREHEISARAALYGRLTELCNARIELSEEALKKTWLEQRRALERDLQSAAHATLPALYAVQYRLQGEADLPMTKRPSTPSAQVRSRLEELLLEKLFYQLRSDPRGAFNDTYHDLADSAWLEHDEDFMTQVEVQVWRLLQDESAHRLVKFAIGDEGPSVEDAWVWLKRIAEQDHALRWLKRLHLRGRYEEVEPLAQAIRSHAEGLPDGLPQERKVKHSWNHTFTVEQANVIVGYALAYTGRIGEAITTLDRAVEELTAVLWPGHQERDEEPFIFPAQPGRPEHSGARNVRRAIGVARFVLGYAYAARGRFQQSFDAYNAALPLLRETRFKALEVYCKFNMARALMEQGYAVEAAKNCEDVLNLLTESGKGGTLPYAYASNTLALVHNARRAHDEAWPQAAVAHACFQRMDEQRGIALALLQLGEALRRLADTYDRQQYRPNRDTPRQLCVESEAMLRLAYRLFTEHPTLREETQRRIEAAIELASSLRDQVRVLDDKSSEERGLAKRMLVEARALFEEAKQLAGERTGEDEDHVKYPLLYLDALWGLATLDYRANQKGLADYREPVGLAPEAVFEAGEKRHFSTDALVANFRNVEREAVGLKLLESGSVVQPGAPARAGESEKHAIRRVGRAFGRMGRIYAEAFQQRSDEARRAAGYPPYANVPEAARERMYRDVLDSAADPHDSLEQTVEDYLQKLAESYVIALGYAEMHNPKGALVDYLYGDIYDRVKAFSSVVMGAFRRHVKDAYQRFNLEQAGEESLLKWLDRSFGTDELGAGDQPPNV